MKDREKWTDKILPLDLKSLESLVLTVATHNYLEEEDVTVMLGYVASINHTNKKAFLL